MKRFLSLIFLSLFNLVSAVRATLTLTSNMRNPTHCSSFQHYLGQRAYRDIDRSHDQHISKIGHFDIHLMWLAWSPPSSRTLWNLHSASHDDMTEMNEFEACGNEAGDTILQIHFSFPPDVVEETPNELKALEAVRTYTKSFPFAAVLPVQPLTYLPVLTSDGDPAVQVTFLRKKTAEKGSMDGGILFHSRLACEEDGEQGKKIHLTAKRISKGQTVSKIFSEKQLIMAFVKALDEARGKEILMQGGNVDIDSVFHLWM